MFGGEPGQEVLHLLPERIQGVKGEPRHLVLHLLPEPLNRVQLRRVRRQEHEPDVFRDLQRFGGVVPSVVHQQEVQAVGERFGEAFQVGAEALAIRFVGLSEEALSCGRFDRSIDVEALELLLERSDGFYPFERDPPPLDRDQAEPTFVLREEAEGRTGGLPEVPLRRSLWEGDPQGPVQARLERLSRLPVFLCGSSELPSASLPVGNGRSAGPCHTSETGRTSR